MSDLVLDLEAIEREWLVQCGPCDYGLVNMGCNCPPGDHRSIIMKLVAEVRRLHHHEQTRAAAIARYSPIVSAARTLREVWRKYPLVGELDPTVVALADAVDAAYPDGRSPEVPS